MVHPVFLSATTTLCLNVYIADKTACWDGDTYLAVFAGTGPS